METESKKVFSNTLEEAQKKFRSNPLLYLTIVLGIVGILFPLLGWLMQTHEINDLDQLKINLENVQNSYKQVHAAIEKILKEESYRWKLSDYDRKLLKKVAQEKRNAFVEFFSLLYFLMQGCFFLFLGILLERKVFLPRRMFPKVKQEKTEKVSEVKAEDVKVPEVKAEDVKVPEVKADDVKIQNDIETLPDPIEHAGENIIQNPLLEEPESQGL